RDERARRLIDAAISEMSVAAALAVAGGDPGHPRLTWYECPPHTSFGVPIAGGRYGFDNPDRAFRYFFTDPAYRYEIRGQRPLDDRASFYLLLESCERKPPGWGYPLAFLYMDAIDFAADGSFVITVDATPTAGRRNHLHLPSDSAHVLIRETMLDWNRQMPTPLSVVRVTGPALPPLDFATMSARIADEVRAQAANEFLWYDHALRHVEDNTLALPQIRPAPPGAVPWGMTTTGRYALEEDEAFVFTLDRETARYLGILVADPWMISIDYARRTSCLNHTEVAANSDGTVTYVVAGRDPGYRNWLDCGDVGSGVILVRWELLQKTPDPATTVKGARRVPWKDLESALPFPMPKVTPSERREQVRARAEGIARRERLLIEAGP
ncbi:MAG TPA: hypothetical protein VJP45_02440, partial [Candidatus Limnocylindria bacterium]|nr:hypothetical protein [Candidatus Limnocylindria bacterium]